MTVPTTHSPESLSNAHTLVLRPGLVSAWWRLDAMTSRPIKEVWLSRPGSTERIEKAIVRAGDDGGAGRCEAGRRASAAVRGAEAGRRVLQQKEHRQRFG